MKAAILMGTIHNAKPSCSAWDAGQVICSSQQQAKTGICAFQFHKTQFNEFCTDSLPLSHYLKDDGCSWGGYWIWERCSACVAGQVFSTWEEKTTEESCEVLNCCHWSIFAVEQILIHFFQDDWCSWGGYSMRERCSSQDCAQFLCCSESRWLRGGVNSKQIMATKISHFVWFLAFLCTPDCQKRLAEQGFSPAEKTLSKFKSLSQIRWQGDCRQLLFAGDLSLLLECKAEVQKFHTHQSLFFMSDLPNEISGTAGSTEKHEIKDDRPKKIKFI